MIKLLRLLCFCAISMALSSANVTWDKAEFWVIMIAAIALSVICYSEGRIAGL